MIALVLGVVGPLPLWPAPLGFWVLRPQDDQFVVCVLHHDGVLEQTVEEQAARVRLSPVEAEDELVQICVDVLRTQRWWGEGGSQGAVRASPVTAGQWVVAINDLLDNGRSDRRHSCGAVVEAVAHLDLMHPPATPMYLRAVSILDRYSHGVCPRRPHLGASPSV